MPRRALLPYLWMLSGSFAFALMGLTAHALRTSCDWQLIAAARTGLALVFAVALTLAAGARLVFFRPATLWMRSIAGSFSLVGTFYAYTRLPPSDVMTLTNMFPIWVAVLSWPLLGEPPPASVWICVASGIAGVALVQRPHLAAGNLASLVALGCSLSTAVAMIGLHRLHAIDPRAIVAHFSGVSLLFCLAALVVFDRPIAASRSLTSEAVALLLVVGVTATIGQLFLTKAFAAGAPARVSVVALSQIAFTMPFEVWLFGRNYDVETLLGMVLILAPTAWLMVRRPAPPRGRAALTLDGEGDGGAVVAKGLAAAEPR